MNPQPVSVTMTIDMVMARGWGAANRERLKEGEALNTGKPQTLKI